MLFLFTMMVDKVMHIYIYIYIYIYIFVIFLAIRHVCVVIHAKIGKH